MNYSVLFWWKISLTTLRISRQCCKSLVFISLSSQSYRNQTFDLLNKSIDWFLYDRDLLHERVKFFMSIHQIGRKCSCIDYLLFLTPSLPPPFSSPGQEIELRSVMANVLMIFNVLFCFIIQMLGRTYRFKQYSNIFIA